MADLATADHHVLDLQSATSSAWPRYAIGSAITILAFGLVGISAVVVNRRLGVAALEAQWAPRAQRHLDQATLYMRTGHYRAAWVHLKLALVLEPLDAQGWRLLGACHAEARPRRALACYRRAYHILSVLGGDEADLGDTAYRAARAAARNRSGEEARRWIGIACRHQADYQDMAMEEPDFAGITL